VITRNSSFAYKGNALGVDGIARKLGVQYIRECSCAARGSVCASPQQKMAWQPRRGVYWAGLPVWVNRVQVDEKWFWVDRMDYPSKLAFSILEILKYLAESPSAAPPPVLTIATN